MSKVVLILVASTAGLGLVSLHLVKQLRDGEATIAQLQTKVAELEQQQAATKAIPPPPPPATPFANAEPPEAMMGISVKQPRPTVTRVPDPPPSAMGFPSHEDRMRQMREYRERQKQLMQDPEYREAMRLQARSNFARQYPGVVQELGLDSQQADNFFGLLADQQARMTEQMEGLWDIDPALNQDPVALQERQAKIQQLSTELQRKNQAEIAAQLGQDKAQAWKEYQSTVGARYQLDQMRNALSAQGVPMADDVSKSMLKALAQAQQAEADEYTAAVKRGAAPARLGANIQFDNDAMEQHLESARKRNQRTLDAISPYLTFEQRAAIEKEQAAQLKLQEAQLRLMKARNANGATAEQNSVFVVQ